MIKLIACDIDNTLVPKHKQPSDNTIECIKELKRRGILFGLASGRHKDGLEDLANKWGIECDFYIGMNGAELYDKLTGQHEINSYLKKEWLKEIFELMSPYYDQINPNVIVGNKRLVRRIDEITLEAYKYSKAGNLPEIVKDESEFWSDDMYKMGFRTPANITPKLEEIVAKHPSPFYQGIKTEYTMFEFSPIEASKGNMLIKFCKRHNIDIKDTMALGDMTNDISLIKAAGVGVCMENGSPDTKAVADVITEKSIEDDGFAYFIRNHVLN